MQPGKATNLPLGIFQLLMLFAVAIVGNAVYEPECQSWDSVIAEINNHLESVAGASSTCNKLDDCVGITCTIRLFSKTFNVDLKLFPCDDPPQMRILIIGSGVNYEQTITHGSTYTIPGLSVSPLPFISVQIQVVVQFEPQEDGGILVGVDLKTEGFPLSYPLFDDVLIETPPCTNIDAFVQDCQNMEEFAESIEQSCSRKSTCDGVDCTETYATHVGPITKNVKVDSGLTVDSCSSPVSLILTAVSTDLNLNWRHTFNESDTVRIDHLAMNANLVVTVIMTPLEDLDHIRTTVEYQIHQSSLGTKTEYFLRDDLVPIPECRIQPSQVPVTELSPPEDECASWRNIEDSLEFSVPSYSIDDCVTLPGCQGFNCTANYLGQPYFIVIEEFHCQDPAYVLVSINGPDEHYTETFTHNETVPLPGVDGVSLIVHIVPESATTIYVGVYVVLNLTGNDPVQIPFVTDQYLQVTPCTTNTTTLESTLPGGRTVTQNPRIRTNDMSGQGFLQGATASNSSDKPIVEPVSGNNAATIALTVLTAVVAAAILIMIVIFVLLYMRHRRRTSDMDILMEDSEGTSRDRYTPWS